MPVNCSRILENMMVVPNNLLSNTMYLKNTTGHHFSISFFLSFLFFSFYVTHVFKIFFNVFMIHEQISEQRIMSTPFDNSLSSKEWPQMTSVKANLHRAESTNRDLLKNP